MFLRITQYITDLIFFHFEAEFRYFYSGFYRYDSFFTVYSMLLLADFRFFVGFVKSGLILKMLMYFFFQLSKRHVIGYFATQDSDQYRNFAKVANVLRDACKFHAALG